MGEQEGPGVGGLRVGVEGDGSGGGGLGWWVGGGWGSWAGGLGLGVAGRWSGFGDAGSGVGGGGSEVGGLRLKVATEGCGWAGRGRAGDVDVCNRKGKAWWFNAQSNRN